MPDLDDAPILGPPVAQHCTRCTSLIDTSEPHLVDTRQVESWQGLMITVHDADVAALFCQSCAKGLAPRAATCPTCDSAQPHLHPTREGCPNPWHQPIPTTHVEWRAEVERWAALLLTAVRGGLDMGAFTRIAADMQRAAEGRRPATSPDPQQDDDRYRWGTDRV